MGEHQVGAHFREGNPVRAHKRRSGGSDASVTIDQSQAARDASKAAAVESAADADPSNTTETALELLARCKWDPFGAGMSYSRDRIAALTDQADIDKVVSHIEAMMERTPQILTGEAVPRRRASKPAAAKQSATKPAVAKPSATNKPTTKQIKYAANLLKIGREKGLISGSSGWQDCQGDAGQAASIDYRTKAAYSDYIAALQRAADEYPV